MKRFIPYILIIAIVGVGVLSPIGVKISHALSPCGINTSMGECLTEMAAGLGNIIIWLVSRLLWVTAHLFDVTLELTVENNTFSSITAVDEGWAAARDIVNMFFIFILLYIAIATILQISGYGIKDLLVKVIIIALLVNFSLMITKVIIDASNILALEFYDKIEIKNPATGEIQKREITQVMMQGLKLQGIYQADELKNPGSVVNKDGIGFSTVIIGTIFGSILILVTAFVFLAATVLFAIRTIALLFLMILAPLAFLAMVLPKTQQYASEWWDKLFKWSFFAPAFMFMIYIVAKIIASDDFQKIIKGVGADPSASIGGAVTGADPGALGVMVNYILLIGLMIGSLIVAQRMGAVGSGAVMSWGKKLKSAGQGYAGKISKRGAGYAAEKALDEKSWINKKTGGRISKAAGLPIVGRGFAKVSSWGQQEKVKKQKEYEKQYGSHSTAGLQAVLKDPTVSDARKAAAKGVMAKRQSGEKEKQELERLERHLPTMETLVPGLKQKIKSIDSDIEDIITDVTAAEYKLAEAVKSGDTMAINLAKGELNVAKKRKAQKLIEKQRATESLSKIEKYGERKEKLEERKERKGETAGLQASISGIKTGGGGKPTP